MKKQLIIGLVLVGVLAACKKDKDNNDSEVAGLMAFHLVSDQPSIGVSLSGNNLPGSPYSYLGYTGYYANIFPGTRSINSTAGSSTTLSTSSYDFMAGEYYSLFIVGANGVYRHIVVEDDYDSLTATAGRSYIRYINAIPDSLLTEIVIGEPGGNLNFTAPYGLVSDFQSVTSGSVTISVGANSLQDTTRTITLEEKKAYTILLSGQRGATNTDQQVQIRFIENGRIE
ncbi:MAG: DUF4397 domain-containing protein [Chitinophagaceae bacterium]|nr:DUF4397 domain-containing protein [Chitinophagaceae bacterium]